MKLKEVKVGAWYETALGFRRCVSVSRFPPSVGVRVVAPIPRGEVHLCPGQVVAELDLGTVAALEGKAGPSGAGRAGGRITF